MQLNNILRTNTVSYRDKFTVKSNAGVLNFDDFTSNTNATNATNVAEVKTQSKELVMPTSSAILKSEVLPNPYGDSLYNVTTTTSVNGQYTTINQYINSTTIDIDNERGITSMTEPNGTAWAYEYSVDSTDERPLITVKHVDENGNYIEQLIDVNAVDPTNCTASEFSALFLHSLEEVASTKPDTLETSHWKASIRGNLSSILGSTNGNMLEGYAKFDDVSNYLVDAHSFADFNLSLPYVENNVAGSDIKEVLALFEEMKNELANSFIENDDLFDAQLDEFDEQIQKQYEYSKWLKL